MPKNLQSDIRSWWQVITIVLLVVCTFSTIYLLHSNYGVWPTVILLPLSSLLFARMFVIYHDCIHNNLFSSWKTNYYVAELLSAMGFHPNLAWGGNHLYHHAHFGKLSAVGRGDIPFATTHKYKNSSDNKKRFFMFMRSPAMPWLFGFLYHIQMRAPLWDPKAEFIGTSTHESSRLINNLRKSVLYNILVATVLLKFSRAMFLYYITTVYLNWVFSFYVFFIQHAHEGSHYKKKREWDHAEAAIRGSSYLKINRLFEYFVASINYHHVHHYDPSIPNYSLERVHNEMFKDDPRLHIIETFSDIKKCFDTNLWDMKNQRWVKNFKS